MITEDYVSFETAKLLKDKGFDAECHSHYYPCHYPDGSIQYHKYERTAIKKNKTWYDIYSLKNLPKDHYLAPTLQMAMKWLEEIHHIIIVADYEYEFTDTSWYYKIYKLGKNGKPERCTVVGARYGNDEEGFLEEIVAYRDYDRSHKEYSTRKEACEAAIKYCIENLI